MNKSKKKAPILRLAALTRPYLGIILLCMACVLLINGAELLKPLVLAQVINRFLVANELGITLNNGYNGNLSSKDAGRVGGNMVRKMIEAQERQMGGQNY